MLLGACFLVNYVTVDEKTNMSEGLTMISFYAMIVSCLVLQYIHILPFVRIGTKWCGAIGYSGVVLPWAATGRFHAQLSGHRCRGGRVGPRRNWGELN